MADSCIFIQVEGAELKAALVSQIEYIFSREYLSGDYSIVSQMNGDLFLSLPFVYELTHFKNLTTDTNAILEALQSSNKVVLDLAAQRVRPNFKLQRNTIILRDIPSEYTEVVRFQITATSCFCSANVPFLHREGDSRSF